MAVQRFCNPWMGVRFSQGAPNNMEHNQLLARRIRIHS